MDPLAAFPLIANQNEGVGPLRGASARVIAGLQAPHHASLFAAHVSNKRQFLQPDQALFNDRRGTAARAQHIASGEIIERRQHRGAGQGIGAPGVGAFAIVKSGE